MPYTSSPGRTKRPVTSVDLHPQHHCHARMAQSSSAALTEGHGLPQGPPQQQLRGMETFWWPPGPSQQAGAPRVENTQADTGFVSLSGPSAV